MTNMAEYVTNVVWRQHNLLGVWPARSEIELGKVGVIKRRTFEHETQLEDLGVSYHAKGEPGTSYWVASSQNAFAVEGEAAADAGTIGLPSGHVAGRLRALRRGAVLLQADNVRAHRIDDLAAVGTRIAELDARAAWHNDWRLVTYAMVAERLNVLVAERSGAEVAVSVEASVLPAPELLEAGSARVGIEFSTARGFEFSETLDGPVTVAFRAARLKRGRLTSTGRNGRLAPPAGAELELAGWDDDED